MNKKQQVQRRQSQQATRQQQPQPQQLRTAREIVSELADEYARTLRVDKKPSSAFVEKVVNDDMKGFYAINKYYNQALKGKGVGDVNKNGIVVRLTDRESQKRFRIWDEYVSEYLKQYKESEAINSLLNDDTSDLENEKKVFLTTIKKCIQELNTDVTHEEALAIKHFIYVLANLYATKKQLFEDFTKIEMNECK